MLSVDELRQWLAAQAAVPRDDRPPLFVFVNLSEPHAPYWRVPPRVRREHGASGMAAQRASLRVLEAQHHGVEVDPALRDSALRSYDAAIAYADSLLGEIVAAMVDDRPERDVCLAVMADHGEMFGEHGVWGHGHGLYRPVLQVPLVMSCPGRLEPGTRVEATVSLTDVAPTLVDLAGGRPGELAPDGSSLLPLLEDRGAAAPHPAGVFAEHEIPEYLVKALDLAGRDGEAEQVRVRRRCVIDYPWRYEQVWSEMGDVEEHLYRLDRDPEEATDLIGGGAPAGAVEAARELMQFWEDAVVGPWSTRRDRARIELPKDTELRLRALGYLD